MNTQPTTSSFIVRAAVLLLTVLTTTGSWAQSPTTVTTEKQLTDAIANGANIQLAGDIQLSKYLDIDGITVTIDLNGHKLSRSLDSHGSAGHVIGVHGGSDLTLTSTAEGYGIVEGGKANNGGAIHIPHGNEVSVNRVIFRNNSALDRAGAIWNNGTFTAILCVFENNESKDVGAVYNSVTSDGAGTATLDNCTFTGNMGTEGAGALANALGATVMEVRSCNFTGNTAVTRGGGIWNGGTLTVTNSTFTNNKATDVGAIYNAVSSDGRIAGQATLEYSTFTSNAGTAGAGALANALGATVMTIEDCTITGNTAGTRGGGVWNGGTLNMKGVVKVTGNTTASGTVSNVFLKSGTVITVTDQLYTSDGPNIGVDLESIVGTFTSGYNDYHHKTDPNTFFTADLTIPTNINLDGNGEARLSISYIERSWDDTNKKVVNTEKGLISLIANDETPDVEGQYKEVTNAPADSPNEWFGMGGYSSSVAEYYVVRGEVNRETIVVQGSNVHLILCDGATLTLTGGLKLEGDNKLYIHSQSYGGAMGRLIVTNKYEEAAGIGSARHNHNSVKVGELVIYGGHIEATGGDEGAGIGSCKIFNNEDKRLCNRVTVYGGYVEAQGGEHAAGIGGGFEIHGGDFILYDGTVIAKGGEGKVKFSSYMGYGINVGASAASGGGAGVGGGGCSDASSNGGYGGNVTVYGGTLTATGGGGAAGIGSAYSSKDEKKQICGGTFKIYGGTVTANGGKRDVEDAGSGAGIGGGYESGGAEVYVYGGTVTANGGKRAAGIGGGGTDSSTSSGGFGGKLVISGGTVTATGGEKAAGIGGGYSADGGDVAITGGTVIAKAGIQGGTGNRAIGPGNGCNNFGTLSIGGAMMVGAGNNGSVEHIFDVNERKNACWFRSYAEISPCTHPSGITYTINEGGTHTSHCKHCAVSETAGHSTGICVCGYEDGSFTITIATSSNGSYYEGVGETVNVGNGKSYTLPVCSIIPEGYDFAGWVVNPTSQDNGIRPNEGETLLQAGEDITVTGNVSIFARYKDIDISLADDGDNYETIFNYDGKVASTVTLTGRTLYRDGNWNTLCLPFAVTDGDATDGVTFSGTPLEGATVLTLDNATFENSTLTLNFEETSAMEPGKPYLVKWASDTEHPTIVNPVFHGVTISNTSTSEKAVVADIVTFKGEYAPLNIGEEGDLTILYLGADNTFRYPKGAMDINAFRAYIHANTSLGDVNGDGVVNVTDVTMLVNHILGINDESFVIENADVTRDGDVTVTDVTALVNLILGGNSIVKMVVNGADGITFGGNGSGPARVPRK